MAFDGFVVSDCGAVNDIVDGHKLVVDLPRASVLVPESGNRFELRQGVRVARRCREAGPGLGT